jgi:hypothetical protein
MTSGRLRERKALVRDWVSPRKLVRSDFSEPLTDEEKTLEEPRAHESVVCTVEEHSTTAHSPSGSRIGQRHSRRSSPPGCPRARTGRHRCWPPGSSQPVKGEPSIRRQRRSGVAMPVCKRLCEEKADFSRGEGRLGVSPAGAHAPLPSCRPSRAEQSQPSAQATGEGWTEDQLRVARQAYSAADAQKRGSRRRFRTASTGSGKGP